MLKFIYKKLFWSNYDYILPNILFSLLWILFELPIFFVLFSLVLTQNYNPNYYIILISFLLFGPPSVGLIYATSFMINGERNAKKVFHFFEGLKKFWLKSIFLFVLDVMILLVFYNSFAFYASKRLQFSPLVQFIFAGLILWIGIFFLFMQLNFLPILVNQKEKIGKVFYKSFLLVLDNLGGYFLLGIFLLSAFVLFAFSILGFILIFPGFYALSLNIITMSFLSKYNKSIVVVPETRKFRHLLKPWE